MHSHEAMAGRVLVLKPVGHLLGGPETDEIVSIAREFAARGDVGVLIDFDDVEYLNSLGLGALTRILITCSRAHGLLRVCNVKDRVRRLFDVVKFHKLFDYHESESHALGALSKELVTKV